MGIAERRQRQKEEVRASILGAGWQLVQQEGWQALSIRKIADAIEYSIPVIYSHFESKDAILLEFTKEGFNLLGQQVQQAKEKHDLPAQQLEAIAWAYWDFAFTHKEYYQLMFGVGVSACETFQKVPQITKFKDIMLSTIQQLIAHGPYPETDAFLKFHTFWSILHGLISMNMTGNTVTPHTLNKTILEDAVQSFIISLTK